MRTLSKLASRRTSWLAVVLLTVISLMPTTGVYAQSDR